MRRLVSYQDIRNHCLHCHNIRELHPSGHQGAELVVCRVKNCEIVKEVKVIG